MNQLHVTKYAVVKLLVALLVVCSASVWAQGNIEPIQLPPIKTVTLDNGLKVIAIEQRSLPIVQFNLRIRVGAINDPSEKAGLSNFTASMLRQGTTTRTADQISEAIDFVGGSLNTTADVDRTSVTVRVLKRDLQIGLELLADIAENPNFPEEEMKIIRNQLLADVRSTQDDPESLAAAHFSFALFGTIHPMGHPMSENSISGVTRDDLITFHGMYYRPNNAVLAVAGDIKSDEMINLVRKALESWKKADVLAAQLPAIAKPQGYQVRFVSKPGQTQTHIELGHSGLAVTDQDYIPTVLANYVLGGGAFSSRLLQVIRSKAGKTYSIFSYFPSYSFPGYFRISTSTRNEEAFSTLQLILDEFKKFTETGITAEELQAAQDNVAGSYVLRLETLSGLTTTVLNNDFYGFTMDRSRNWRKMVHSVTLEQANQAIRDRFDARNVTIVLLSDVRVLQGIRELLPGLPLENVNVVDWLAPITARTKPYVEFIAAPVATEPTQLEWKAEMTPEAKALVEKAIAAQGGFDRLASLRDTYIKARGSIFQGGQEIKVEAEVWIKLPNKLRQKITFAGGESTVIYNGVQGWVQSGPRTRDLPAQSLTEVREAIEFDNILALWNIAREGYRFESKAKDQVEGREVQILRVTNAQGRAADFYFDLERSVPLKITTQTAESKRKETLLSDYRQSEGFQLPFVQKTLENNELTDSFELLEFKVNTGVADDLFEKP